MLVSHSLFLFIYLFFIHPHLPLPRGIVSSTKASHMTPYGGAGIARWMARRFTDVRMGSFNRWHSRSLPLALDFAACRWSVESAPNGCAFQERPPGTPEIGLPSNSESQEPAQLLSQVPVGNSQHHAGHTKNQTEIGMRNTNTKMGTGLLDKKKSRQTTGKIKSTNASSYRSNRHRHTLRTHSKSPVP